MVGVPRSSGCQLCRKRRVKCDEQRPSCGNCQKYGADCPGYERGLKFVEGKHQIRQRGRQSDRGQSERSQSDREQSDHQSATSGSSSDGSRTVLLPRQTASLVTPLARALLPLRGQLIHVMIDNFRPANSPHDIVGIFSWIPSERLGKRAILDGAICSLALHLTGKESKNTQVVAQSRSLYGQCLAELQSTLKHDSEWKSSETLCSAILLCFYELFAGTSAPDTWLQHAKGVGVLMRQRGPAAHAKGWDAAMLLYFRGILIMSDMFFPGDDGCFLSRPQWKRVMRDKGRHLIHPPDLSDEIIQVVDNFHGHLVDVPDILKWGYMLREGNKLAIAVDPARVAALAQHTAQTHARFISWYDDEVVKLPLSPFEIPCPNPETSLYATVLDWPAPWIGSMHLSYWASMLILQETLTQCGWPVKFEASQHDFVQKILRSVETVGRGTMGPYRVGYALRIVYEFASVEAQEWIQRLLVELSQRYAALDKSLYPETRQDSLGYS